MTRVYLRDANIEGANFEGAIIVDKDGNEVPFDVVAATAPEESRTTRVAYTPLEQWKGILSLANAKRANQLGLTPKTLKAERQKEELDY